MIEQIIQFIKNHLGLSLAGVGVLALIAFEELKSKLGAVKKISPQDVAILINREKTLVVDLRNQKAFAAGHILGSINIPKADLDPGMKKLETHKDDTLILLDDTEASALAAANKLHTHGFAKTGVLAGGITAWKDSQLPLNKI